jgi:RNA polymerase sigma-70 factor, ECF subfamily
MGAAGLPLPWEHRIAWGQSAGESRRVGTAEQGPQSSLTANTNPEDAVIAARCLAGDLGGYEELFRLHGTRMRNFARNLLSSQSDAEDAVQETFLKVQRGITSFRGQSSFVTWTFRILVNTCHDLRRSRMRRKEHSPDDSENAVVKLEPRAPGGHPSLRMALERAIAQLTKHQRDVFLLYEVEGFRHAEIAGILEITETASKNTLFQAKKSLRTMLEPPRSANAGGAL